MSARTLSTTGILTAATALTLIRFAAVDVQAQMPADGRGATAAASSWVPPRTPWGDPDLQGIFTNKYKRGTPFERRTRRGSGPDTRPVKRSQRLRVVLPFDL
jgi:hypothetical protein